MLRQVFIFSVGLFGCGFLCSCQPASSQGYNAPYSSATLSSQDYLQLTSGQQQNQHLFAAAAALQNNNSSKAQQVLDTINKNTLNANDQVDYTLLKAQLALFNKNYASALIILNSLSNSSSLTTAQQFRLHQIAANSYRGENDLINTIDQYDKLFLLTTDAQQQMQIASTTWQAIQKQQQNAAALNLQTNDRTIKGWLALAILTNQSNLPAPEFLSALNQWRQQFPNHPATVLISAGQPNSNLNVTPKQIALLLPLSGPLQNQAKAIQNGFFAAYFATKQQGFNPSIRVYNTQDKDIVAVYQQAQADGANFVVGPLLKTDIDTLVAKHAITIPTLALNTTDDSSSNPMLYQFGLSPTDEAQEVAARIWQEHHRRVIIIAPTGSWSQNIVSTFQKNWQQLGGNVADVVLYNQRDQISTQIRRALNIDGTDARYQELRSTLHHKIRFLPYRREDFDAIFFVASNDFARQIVPILKFYFAGNVPTYTLSTVYPGTSDPSRDHDLNDVIFDDMPWVLDQTALSPTLRNLYGQAQSTWPRSFNEYKRLIALGADSYLIIPRLGKLSMLPQFGFSGATGVLYVLPNQHIYRQLSFAQFKAGRPVLLN